MERIFHPYSDWEDYKNGMYKNAPTDIKDSLVNKAKMLLSNTDKLYEAMKRVTQEWDIATQVNLTNIEKNRRAWMGQSACSIEHKVPEDLTREAWMKLNDTQRKMANLVAEKVIYEWTTNHIKQANAKEVFEQGRLQFDY